MKKIQDIFKNILNWFKMHNIYDKSFYKKNGRTKRWIAIFSTSFVSVLLVAVIVITSVLGVYLSKLERGKINVDNLNVSQEAEQLYSDSGIINVMLYGIDSRDMSEQSRSDAIMLLSIDKDHAKIKLTSFARDTYVDIEGYGKDKLNHAFVYGWNASGSILGGAELSMKTINTNFGLNVKDYVTANFWALAKIIDYVGGVTIDVDDAERYDINKNYIPHIRSLGIACEDITTTGLQTLTGGQAVAYCRERYVGGDVARGGRQREVISAMFEKAKGLSPLRYPGLIDLILNECSTSLTNTELLSMGTWAVSKMGELKVENLGLPTSDIDNGGTMINGVWYYTYDLVKATAKIQEFILETNTQQQPVQ